MSAGMIALLARLEVRHMRSDLRFLFFAAGTDIDDDRDLMERAYQLYVLVFLIAVAALSWGQVMHVVASARDAMGAAPAGALACAAFAFGPALALAGWSLSGLRETPLRLDAPDMAWLSRVARPEELLLVRIAKLVACWLVFGALAGALLGVLASATSVVAWAAVFAPVAASVRVASLLAGLVRSAAPRSVRTAVAAVAGAVAVLASLALAATLVGALFGLGLMLAAVAFASAAALASLCLLLASRADMAFVVDDSELFAARRSLRFLALVDAGAYREACRRSRVRRRRGPLRTRRFRAGRGALVSHALTSLVREPSSALPLLTWAVLLVPLGALLMVSQPPVGVLLSWLLSIAFSVREPLALARVFREDCRNRLVRSMLPFGALELLLLDSLPALCASVIASGVVCWLAAGVTGASPLAAIALAALLNVVLMLSCGFDDPLRAARGGSLRLSAPAASLVSLVVVAACSFVGPQVALVAAAAIAALLAARLAS